MLAIQCNPDIPVEPGKPLSVELESASVILPYAEPVKLNYTIMNADGGIDVKIQSLPSTIGYTNHYTGGANGYVELLSSLDDNKTFNVYVTVKDGKTTVNKDVKITTTKKDVPFSVDVDASTVNVAYGTPATLSYSAVGFKGDVSVTLKNPIDGIDLSANMFNKASGTGELRFTTTKKEEEQYNAVLCFNDTNTNIEKNITINTSLYSSVPSEPVVTLESDIIYPYDCELPLQIPFTVACEDNINDIIVTATSGLETSVETALDKKSGTITVKAKENLGESAEVTVTAKNAAGQASKSFTLYKAYFNISNTTVNVAHTASTTQYSLQIWTNIEFKAELDDPQKFITWHDFQFVHAQQGGGNFYFKVSQNDSYAVRTATLKLTESMGKFNTDVIINQVGIEGSYDTDREALIAIYNALNMKEWTENGVGGVYYSNWCTDEILDNWLGIATTGYEREGRVWRISLIGVQENSTGYIPEEIGQLTRLTTFDIFPYHKITHLPESFENLLNLQDVSFQGDDMEHIDISQWTGFTKLMNNPNNKMKWITFARTKLHGTIPDYLAKVTYEAFQFEITDCHFSGQVPDAVANKKFWSLPYMYSADRLRECPRFDSTKYELSEDGWYYKVPFGEAMMYMQADNYALWVGERPSNTKWVDDNLGGHWEWTK